MFMLKSTLDLMSKKDEKIDELKDNIQDLKLELRDASKRADRAESRSEWEVEKVKNDVKKDMQKKLIESDLLRTEAVAKLNTYIDMDTKEERKHIQNMLEKAIEGLGKQKEIKIVKEE